MMQSKKEDNWKLWVIVFAVALLLMFCNSDYDSDSYKSNNNYLDYNNDEDVGKILDMKPE